MGEGKGGRGKRRKVGRKGVVPVLIGLGDATHRSFPFDNP